MQECNGNTFHLCQKIILININIYLILNKKCKQMNRPTMIASAPTSEAANIKIFGVFTDKNKHWMYGSWGGTAWGKHHVGMSDKLRTNPIMPRAKVSRKKSKTSKNAMAYLHFDMILSVVLPVWAWSATHLGWISLQIKLINVPARLSWASATGWRQAWARPPNCGAWEFRPPVITGCHFGVWMEDGRSPSGHLRNFATVSHMKALWVAAPIQEFALEWSQQSILGTSGLLHIIPILNPIFATTKLW
jgi:hypothetical protein